MSDYDKLIENGYVFLDEPLFTEEENRKLLGLAACLDYERFNRTEDEEFDVSMLEDVELITAGVFDELHKSLEPIYAYAQAIDGPAEIKHFDLMFGQFNRMFNGQNTNIHQDNKVNVGVTGISNLSESALFKIFDSNEDGTCGDLIDERLIGVNEQVLLLANCMTPESLPYFTKRRRFHRVEAVCSTDEAPRYSVRWGWQSSLSLSENYEFYRDM